MREANTYHRLRDLLQSGGRTKWLKTQAKQRSRLLVIVAMYIPAEERDALLSCNIHEHTLFLKVSSQALATRLRFENRELLKSLAVHEEFAEIRKISIGISRQSSEPPASIRRKHTPLRRINPGVKELLEDSAEQFQDEKLAAAMRALAAKASDKTGKKD